MQDTEVQRAALLQVCAGLHEGDQRALEFLSVFYVPESPAELMDFADRAGLRAAPGQKYTRSSWEALLGRLRAGGLLMEEGDGLRCHLLVAEVLTRRVSADGRLTQWARVARQGDGRYRGGVFLGSEERLLRDLREALYSRDASRVRALLRSGQYLGRRQRSPVWFLDRTVANPLDPAWMRTLPREVLVDVLFPLATSVLGRLGPADEVMSLVEEVCAGGGEGLDFLEFARMRHRVLTGRLVEALELSRREGEPNHLVIRGWVHVLTGDDRAARVCYDEALKQMQRIERTRKVYFRSEAGLFYIVSLMRAGAAQDLKRAADLAQLAMDQQDGPYGPVYGALLPVVRMLCGDFDRDDEEDGLSGSLLDDGDELPGEVGDPPPPEVEQWAQVVSQADLALVALSRFWLDAGAAAAWTGHLEAALGQAQANGYRVPAAELQELLFRLTGKARYGEAAARTRQELGTVPLADAVTPSEPWRRALAALAAVPAGHGDGAAPAAEERLVWLLGGTEGPGVGLSLEPRVQKVSKKGHWTKGREVALRRLYLERDEFDCLTDQDRRVCECLESYDQHRGWGRYTHSGYRLRMDRALYCLVGHPLVFLKHDPSTRAELAAGEAELRVGLDASGQEVILQLVPPVDAGGPGAVVVREGPAHYRVVQVTDELRRMARILGPTGVLRAPAEARDEVLEAAQALASVVTVQSAIGGGTAEVEALEADVRPHVQLVPRGDGLSVALRVYPLGPQGTPQVPGVGGATVFGRVDGRPVQASRDLDEEGRRARAVEEGCPVLGQAGLVDGQWRISGVEDCLELLVQLQELGDAVVVEWPQGERFRVARQAGLDGLRLRVRRERDWFQMSAQLPVDDNLVLDMRRLLDMAREGAGRFLPLGHGQFLALTSQLCRRLAEIEALGEAHGDGARFHRLMAPLVEELLEDVPEVEVDAAWEQQRQRLVEASELEPAVPATLQARLRDYQVAGYEWLARLSHWGVGACLADDMGLGKTVQALAVILGRAPAGPTLVVAPTSVGDNWVVEARRFAPTLRPVLLRDEDRAAVLEGAGAFDLVVCSYALLHRESRPLAAVAWQTVVLDEAQAIKNPQARRSQAARALQAEFRLITTGTPVENNLGELWSLFRFLNPGLLGSRTQFAERYARPIERDGDRAAVRRLRQVLQPFVLRRLKSEVLDELPPRTEVTRTVEMGRAEAALYEALRQEAVAEAEAGEAPDGQRYVQILAQIMRLRRACCHPSLAVPDADVPCAKLEVFVELLRELLEGGHKALVFSQFVDYLTIVRQVLEDEGVSYQYLDGRTPAKDRQRRVDAFQAGEGDAFLISLRAGGQGLNLTAADYVIHLDPWWNPAVEDQASDRAHRIGQERPVTVYRLVTRGTIEERIVAMHAEKRELAEGVLAGAGGAAKLSADQLLALLRE